MSDSNQLAVVEPEIIEGPVVAVQYPSKPDYSSDKLTGSELAAKYSDLMRIDPDDNDKYKELCAAIKDIITHRTDNDKEEKTIKKPLNAFRTLVGNTGKKIRQNIIDLAEEPLKAEKKRVDDIKANRLLEQQKLWMENLKMIRRNFVFSSDHSIEKLRNTLDCVDEFDLSEFDLGDYEEDAKVEIANKKIALETEIERRKEDEKLRLEQVKLKKEQDEKEEKLKRVEQALLDQQQKQKIINAEIEAYADNSERETKKLMAELELLKAENEAAKKDKTEKHFKDMGENDRENNTQTVVQNITDIGGTVHSVVFDPEPMKESIKYVNKVDFLYPPTVEINTSIIDITPKSELYDKEINPFDEPEPTESLDSPISVEIEDTNEVIETKITGSFDGVNTVTQIHSNNPSSDELEITGFSNTVFPSPFDEPATAPEPHESPYIEDNIKLDTFIGSLKYVMNEAPIDFEHNEYVQAVNRVVESINKANGFLNSVRKD